jgi:hypothetical protein
MIIKIIKAHIMKKKKKKHKNRKGIMNNVKNDIR